MKPTSIGLLGALAATAGSMGWASAHLVYAWRAQVVTVGWGTALTLALLTGALGIWGLLSRPRLQRRPGTVPLPPLVAARTAALALACSRTGALSIGAYAGILIGVLPRMASAAARTDVWTCGVTVVVSAALTGIALWIESMCRIKDGDDDEGGSKSPVEPAGA
ncbi:MAG: hypothetical protein RL745_858 [Actinomycetota bacterium]|jgi:hypothetical protein